VVWPINLDLASPGGVIAKSRPSWTGFFILHLVSRPNQLGAVNPRRAELQRQRDLVATHLAWLDRELAALPAAPDPSAPSPDTAVPPPSATLPVANDSPATTPRPWPEMPTPNEQPLSRTGCWVTFSVILLALSAVGVGVIYSIYS